ncbi:hypothetical protein PTKU15_83780 [Paraburkholderia terrae]|nr:hypothetical protein PTKU15_83780 [Paraburkholderia terrae]
MMAIQHGPALAESGTSGPPRLGHAQIKPAGSRDSADAALPQCRADYVEHWRHGGIDKAEPRRCLDADERNQQALPCAAQRREKHH